MRKISDDFLKSDIPKNEGFFSVEIKGDYMFTLLFPSSEFKKLMTGYKKFYTYKAFLFGEIQGPFDDKVNDF
jgi:hypothetical protein